MKAKITRTDGTVLELEGTEQEIATVVQALLLQVTVGPIAVGGPLTIPSTPAPYVNPVWCAHEYPNPWMGTQPPSCIKCGQPSGWWVPYTIVGSGCGVTMGGCTYDTRGVVYTK